jgi:hypothetical protein
MIHEEPAKPEDAFELQLREEDAREVPEGWREELSQAIRAGQAFSYRDFSGALVGIFGFNESSHEVGPWLLCSRLVGDHRRALVQSARLWVKFLQAYAGGRLIYNYIPKNSPSNRAFVQALGFRILPSPREGFDFFYLPYV